MDGGVIFFPTESSAIGNIRRIRSVLTNSSPQISDAEPKDNGIPAHEAMNRNHVKTPAPTGKPRANTSSSRILARNNLKIATPSAPSAKLRTTAAASSFQGVST